VNSEVRNVARLRAVHPHRIQRGSTTVLRRLLIPAAVLGALLLTTTPALAGDIGWDSARPAVSAA
jgi:hypothetical protein